jgi:DNA-binding MarR family transcriptional regulator
MSVELTLSRRLNTLTTRLARAADRLLRSEAGLSYSQFLALFMVGRLGVDTQRELAERLTVTEPSVSRMTRVLHEAGWLEVSSHPTGGNRRRLRLTPSGEQVLARWGGTLEQRFAALVEASGVPYNTFSEYTQRLLLTLDAPVPDDNRTASRRKQPPHQGGRQES